MQPQASSRMAVALILRFAIGKATAPLRYWRAGKCWADFRWLLSAFRRGMIAVFWARRMGIARVSSESEPAPQHAARHVLGRC